MGINSLKWQFSQVLFFINREKLDILKFRLKRKKDECMRAFLSAAVKSLAPFTSILKSILFLAAFGET